MTRAIRRTLPLVLLTTTLLAPAGSKAPGGAGTAEVTVAPEDRQEEQREGKELLYKLINFLLLAGGLTYILRKPAREYFAQRSAMIRKSLEEGRKALEASQAQLGAVEEKLRHLDEEIREFKESAKREMEAERERLRETADAEGQRILESARAQMEAAVKAAKLELKIFAARQAVELAEGMVRERLDDSGRKRMVNRFIEQLADGSRPSPQSGS
jgi:F-type H+-transporting ATPase subunit b